MRDIVYRVAIAAGLFLFGPLWRLRISCTGAEHVPAEGGAVLAVTHFGYLDFALTERVVWGCRRRMVRFLATDAAFRHPVSGPLLRAMRHVPVDRAAGTRAYEEAVRRLRGGQLVGVFPESSVNRAYVVRPCKTGAVRMAAAAGVPLVPVAVWGGQRVMTRGRRIRARERRGVAVRVVFGAPVHPTPGHAVARTEELRARLQELVGRAQAGYPQRPAPGDDWWLPAGLGGSAPTPEQAAAMDAADAFREHRAVPAAGAPAKESA